MSNNKWGIFCLITAYVAIMSGGIAIFFSIISALSLNKFFRAPTVSAE
jgi:hypothetical protein